MAPPISQFKSYPSTGIGNVLTDVYEAPVGKDAYLLQLDVSVTGNTGIQVDIVYLRSGTPYYLAKNVPIPVGATLEYIEDKKQVVEAGDKIQVRCVTPSETVDVVISAVEDVNN